MIYVNESDIRCRFSTLVLLHDGRTLRKGEYAIIRGHCPECERPLGSGEEVAFVRQVGACKLCVNPDPLAWCQRTLARAVWPSHVQKCMELCLLIDPRSAFRQSYNHRNGRIDLRWSFDTMEAYLRIGPAVFDPDSLTEDEIRRLMQETIKLGPGTGGKRFHRSSSSSASPTEEKEIGPTRSGRHSSSVPTSSSASKTMSFALT